MRFLFFLFFALPSICLAQSFTTRVIDPPSHCFVRFIDFNSRGEGVAVCDSFQSVNDETLPRVFYFNGSALIPLEVLDNGKAVQAYTLSPINRGTRQYIENLIVIDDDSRIRMIGTRDVIDPDPDPDRDPDVPIRQFFMYEIDQEFGVRSVEPLLDETGANIYVKNAFVQRSIDEAPKAPLALLKDGTYFLGPGSMSYRNEVDYYVISPGSEREVRYGDPAAYRTLFTPELVYYQSYKRNSLAGAVCDTRFRCKNLPVLRFGGVVVRGNADGDLIGYLRNADKILQPTIWRRRSGVKYNYEFLPVPRRFRGRDGQGHDLGLDGSVLGVSNSKVPLFWKPVGKGYRVRNLNRQVRAFFKPFGLRRLVAESRITECGTIFLRLGGSNFDDRAQTAMITPSDSTCVAPELPES